MIRARLLGEFSVEVNGRRVERFRTQRTALLLAYLLRYPQPHAREDLARLLWGELTDEAALNNLRVSLSSLRAVLEPPGTLRGSVLQTTRHTVGLNPDYVETDVAQFEAAVRHWRAATEESERMAWANRARSLYQGAFLQGFEAPWIHRERERLQQLYEALPVPTEPAAEAPPISLVSSIPARPISGLGVVVGVQWGGSAQADPQWVRSAVAVCGGAPLQTLPNGLLAFFTDLDKLVRFLLEVARHHPEAVLALDLGHLRVVRQRYEGAPLRVVERLLQLEGSGYALCTQRVVAVLPQALTRHPIQAHPLGAYWLSAEFPQEPLFALALPGWQVPTHLQIPAAFSAALPHLATSFIGREADLASVVAALQTNGARLYTIIGAPGSGKTRFAIEVARHTESIFGEARWWITIAHPTESILEVWARCLRWDTARLQQLPLLLAGILGNRRALLVIDWLHLPSDAQRTELQALLHDIPTLTVLTSAPTALNLPDEQIIELHPLEVPPDTVNTVDALWRYGAVRLFVERARQANPDFRLTEGNASLVAAISRLLSGLPLAIELAAARLSSVSLAQLVQRLEDTRLWKRPAAASAFGRSLWDSLTACYMMLPPPQQTLLNRLSVLSGGWTPECACEVLGVPCEELDTLVRTGLVRLNEGRYEMPPLVRQFAAQFTSSNDRRAVLSRYLYYWCEQLERAAPQAVDWARLEAERHNLDAVLEWSTHHEPLSALRLALVLTPFWEARGGSARALHALTQLPAHLTRPEEQLQAARIAAVLAIRRGAHADAHRLLHTFLPVADAHPQLIQAARLWFAAGFYHWSAGNLSESERYLRMALERSRALGAADDQAEVLLHLGVVLWIQERLDEAATMLEQATEQAAGRLPRLQLNALGNLASVRYQQGDLAQAELLLQQAQTLALQQGDLRTLAAMLNNQGVWQAERGNFERARQLYYESLSLWRRISEPMGEAVCTNNLGDLALREGDYETAESLFRQSARMARRYRIGWYLYHPLQNLAETAARRGDWCDALVWARRCLHALNGYQSSAPLRLKTLHQVARYALQTGDYRLAAQALFAVARLNETPDSSLLDQVEQSLGATQLSAIRQHAEQMPMPELLSMIALADEWSNPGATDSGGGVHQS